jgi:hypothetical protein
LINPTWSIFAQVPTQNSISFLLRGVLGVGRSRRWSCGDRDVAAIHLE